MLNRWAAVVRSGGVGDNLIAASVLRPLKRMGYMTEVISGPPNHVVFHNNPFMDKLAVKLVGRDIPKDDPPAWQKWFEGRSHEYDVFVHASHSCEGRHALFKHMTGFWWSPEYRRKMCAGSYLETVHDLACIPHEWGPLFFPTDEERDFALVTKNKIGPFILWVLSGTRVDKVYPYAPQVVARIVKEVGAPVVLMGGPHQKEELMSKSIVDYVELVNGSRKGVHRAIPSGDDASLCWPLRTSLSFALSADLVVTPDTGTAWAVAFEPMPKIVLVSHASAENITKHWRNTTTLHADPDRVPCWPCHRLHDDQSTCVPNKDDNGAACVSDISVDRLVETVAEAWSKREKVPQVVREPGWAIDLEGGGRRWSSGVQELSRVGSEEDRVSARL